MAKLGSKQNPLIMNVHDEELAQEITEICNFNGWYYILGMDRAELPDTLDLIQKLEPPTVQYSSPKVQRNDPCPCGSAKKYKKCCIDKTEVCSCCGQPVDFNHSPAIN